MRRTLVVPFLIFLFGCSSRQPGLATAASGDRPTPVTETTEWEQTFAKGHLPEDRSRAAVMLLRHGTSDPKYWDYLASDAGRALQLEKRAALAWKRSNTVEKYETANSSQQPATADPWHSTNASATSAAPTKTVPGEFAASSSSMYSRTLDINLAERAPDARYVAPIIMISLSGDRRAAPLLHAALNSENVLMASQAALGLAKLHDKSAIEEIKVAAGRFPDANLTFAQALVYFRDPIADTAATRIVNDPDMLRDLKKVASDNNYDPFPERE